MKTGVVFKYFVHDCIWNHSPSNWPRESLNVICFTILITLRPLTQFILELEQLIFKNVLKFVLFDN